MINNSTGLSDFSIHALPHEIHEADLCVVGGGMAGFAVALAAARHGASVILMHDRPVLGGNASSEIRVQICGADRSGEIPHLRETGIVEEIRLENLRRNPSWSYSIWDMLLYEKVRFQPGLLLLLNCSCQQASIDGTHITSITGWQLTTQTYHTVHAKLFVDCSGDAILAPLTGADFRMGREGRQEYHESIAPEIADARTMGMTCLFQVREYDTLQSYTPPSWAYSYDEDDLPYGAHGHPWWKLGYWWWIELGGEQHSISDTERLRDELLRIALGVWDHIKNRGDHGAENWALEWLQFLPGKRESRRYIGEHVLCQGDVEEEGRFDDLVAYGGWTMDDHHPAGFHSARLGYPATIHHAAPSPFGIPYRALYSRNIDNLMFAGRCASCTHTAMSSTRVMGTCMSMGQAVGVAAAIAVRDGLSPRGVGAHRLHELQQTLLADDCYLPWLRQEFTPTTLTARLTASHGDAEPIRDGIHRQVGDNSHCWTAAPGDWLAYEFQHPIQVDTVTLILDSAMEKVISFNIGRADTELPTVIPRNFRLEGLAAGKWIPLHQVMDNYQRLVRLPVAMTLSGLRWTLEDTWGAAQSRVYGFYV